MAEVQAAPTGRVEDVPSRISETSSLEHDRALVLQSQSSSRGRAGWFRYPFLAAGLALFLGPLAFIWSGESAVNPSDYAERTRRVLKSTP